MPGRRWLGPIPQLTGKSWEDVAQRLEEFLRKLSDSEGDGIPAGFGNDVSPSGVEVGSAASLGSETSGWAATDHVHSVLSGPPDTVGLSREGTEGTSTAVARTDHVHPLEVRRSVGVTILGAAGQDITPGFKGQVVVPFSGVVSDWWMRADPAGDAVVDVWKAWERPSLLNSICGPNKPTLEDDTDASGSTYEWSGLAVTKGDVFGFNVDSVSGVKKLTLSVNVIESDPGFSNALLGYWRMDEASGTRYDTSGSGNHLEEMNGVSVPSALGVLGDCANFTTGTLNSLRTSEPLAFDPEAGLTVILRIKPKSNFNFHGLIYISSFLGVWTGSGGQYTVSINGQLDDGTVVNQEATINSALSTTEWSDAALWWDPSDGKLHIYHRHSTYGPNLAVTPDAPFSRIDCPEESHFYVSWDNGLAPADPYKVDYLDGYVDEVALYNRALSWAELEMFWRRTRPPGV